MGRLKGVKKIFQKLEDATFSVATMISPTLNTKMRYRSVFGKKLDLNNPTTLNEKLLWLKLNRYMNDPLVIQCADKYLVRDYVKACGCEEILNDLLGVWDRANDIPFDTLPDQFVLKWNFGAGMNIICPDKSKLDWEKTREQLNKWGKRKYWLHHSEMQYKYIPAKIVCERFLSVSSSQEKYTAIPDYKVYCFHGEPKYVLVCLGRELGRPKFYFVDTDWNLARINRDGKNAPQGFQIEKPACGDKLIEYAKKLSAPFPFVRTDFYAVGEQVYFGELTFTPAAGMDGNRLPETDLMLGAMLDLKYENKKSEDAQ